MLVFIFLSSFYLQGCESEKDKLEKERIKLEVEKLKHDSEVRAKQEAAQKEFFKTDKIKDYKSKPDPF
jgi:hypothetical protein